MAKFMYKDKKSISDYLFIYLFLKEKHIDNYWPTAWDLSGER